MTDVVINVLALVGAAVIAAGLGMIYVPLGVIAAGVMCLLAAVAIARIHGKPDHGAARKTD